ncbi:hypothetical protein AB0877_29480 [Micromonospora sp. NPDC047644]|uniref:hypothetical protein n=1 Tax=Micromonospora sp. NPDC047644 TaxID=3157203 RepID=UPI003454EBE9
MDRDEARELATAEFVRRMRAGKPRGGFRIEDWHVGEPYEEELRGLTGKKPYLVVDFVPQGDAELQGYRKLGMAVDPETGELDMVR